LLNTKLSDLCFGWKRILSQGKHITHFQWNNTMKKYWIVISLICSLFFLLQVKEYKAMFCTSLFVLFLLVIVLSVLRFTAFDYPFGIFWSLCCLPFFDLRLLITPLVSFGHCVVCSSSIYGFWLPLWYLWSLCCLSFFDLRLLITPLYLQTFLPQINIWK
jgi:hypothetical protein